jgi:hypothetical protein
VHNVSNATSWPNQLIQLSTSGGLTSTTCSPVYQVTNVEGMHGQLALSSTSMVGQRHKFTVGLPKLMTPPERSNSLLSSLPPLYSSSVELHSALLILVIESMRLGLHFLAAALTAAWAAASLAMGTRKGEQET